MTEPRPEPRPGAPEQRGNASLRAIAKNYGSVRALVDVDLELRSGVTALLGRNGAGKSTLVRLLVGVERPTSGDVTVDGRSSSDDEKAFHRSVGWLPQVFGFPRSMRVREFVAYAAWLKDVAGSPTEAAANALVFADVADVADRRLGTLSGGTLRRVGLAASVVHRPALLVLDEPTTGLDPIQRAGLHDRVAELGRSSTVLMATHILEDVAALADRVEVLHEGSVIWRGTKGELGALTGSPGDDVEHLRAGFAHLVGGEVG